MSNSHHNPYPRGSTWHKWDLHVHTRVDPNYQCLGTESLTAEQLNSLIGATGLSRAQITSQEKELSAEEYAKLFIKYLELFSDLSVVAITNHNTGDELDEIITESEAAARSVTVLPGVEVSSLQGIHILCIFNPEVCDRSNWKDYIDHFLTRVGITGPRFDGGRPVITQKTVQEILELTNESGGLCIFPHISSDNGLFHRSNTASSGNAHIDIYKHKLCQILQIPTEGTVSEGTRNIIGGRDPQYGSKRAVQIKASDAKRLTALGGGFTWIKANPTFRGLEQILFEPELRTHLGESPAAKKPYFLIDTVRFIDNTGEQLFPGNGIALNPDLNAIIGGRSTGKSILLYYIARAIDSQEVLGRLKALPAYTDYHFHDNPNFDVEVSWSDGTKTLLSDRESGQDEIGARKILYIPQGYLNRLSETNVQSKRTLNRFVLNVLLQDSVLREGHSELMSSTVKSSRNISTDIDELFSVKESIDELQEEAKQLGSLKGVQDFIRKIEEEIEKIKADSDLSEEELSEYSESTTQEKEISANLTKLRNDLPTLDRLKRQLIEDAATMRGTVTDIIDDLESGLAIDKTETAFSFLAQLDQQIAESTEAIKSALNEQINAQEKQLKELQATLKPLRAKVSTQEQLEKKTAELAAERKTETEIQSIQKKLGVLRKKYEKRKKSIVLHYEGLYEAYRAFQRTCKAYEERFEDMSLTVSVAFSEDSFNESVVNEFLNKQDIKKSIKGYAWKEEFEYRYESTNHMPVITQILDGLLDNSLRTVKGKSPKDAVSKLFGNYYYLDLCITYRNDPLNRMSPGKRGLVLLKLLIDLSEEEWPILLDQPEDDLDNRSVYVDLVSYLRRRKIQRQVISATHNPNRGVGADAEEVIVANQDGQEVGRDNRMFRFEYVSGAVENSFAIDSGEEPHILYQKGIREHVCEILEGGKEAFQKREQKYSFPD